MGSGQVTPRQHRHQALGAERTNQAIEGHRGEMIDDRHHSQLSPPCVAKGIASHLQEHIWR